MSEATPPTPSPPAPLPDPKPIRAYYADWYDWIQAVAGVVVFAIGAVFTALFGHGVPPRYQPLFQAIGYAASAALVATGVWAWRRLAPRPLQATSGGGGVLPPRPGGR